MNGLAWMAITLIVLGIHSSVRLFLHGWLQEMLCKLQVNKQVGRGSRRSTQEDLSQRVSQQGEVAARQVGQIRREGIGTTEWCRQC